jgi:hypothetical protein
MPKTTSLSRAVILLPILSHAAGTDSAFCCHPGRRADPHHGHRVAGHTAFHGGHYRHWRSHELSRGGFQARFALISSVGPTR